MTAQSDHTAREATRARPRGRSSAPRRRRGDRLDLDALGQRLGIAELQELQRRAADEVISGRDTLVVAPTGFGKSVIYELAALGRPGPTLVVSPLVSLQHDQLQSLRERGLKAFALNASTPAGEVDDALAALADGRLEFLLLAPEQLRDAERRSQLAASRPSLVVVDEAHCVTSWGHDFRPDYQTIGPAVEQLGRPPVLALTATAAGPTREDIVAQLRLDDPAVLVTGFDRPELFLEVRRVLDEGAKRDALAEAVEDGVPTLVYVSTRRRCEDVAEWLRSRSRRVGAYHAGLRRADRDVVQADFLANDLDVVVATTAFGMGIDKPDVRRVVHYDIPESLDDYYQQIGRAGRDGGPARARLLFDDSDLAVHKFFKVRDRVNIGVVQQVLAAVASSSTPVARDAVAEQVGGGPRRVTAALATLARVGGVRLTDGGSTVEPLGDPRQALERVIADDASNQRLQQSRIDMMHGYAETRSCRRQYLLAYFGESYDPPCGGCDVCRRDAEAASTDGHGGTQQRATPPWPVHGTVVHDAFGAGEVMGYEGDVVTILFAEHGYKTLAVPSLVERRLVH